MSKFIFLFLSAILLMSCGKQPQIIKSIKVQSDLINQDLFINLETEVEIGQISLPYLVLPIYHPRTFEELGKVTTAPLNQTRNLLKIELNISAMTEIPTQIAQLPNGGLVPFMGNQEVIVIAIDSKAYIYIDPRQSSFSIGLALPFSTLDQMGAQIGNTSLFPVFAIDKAYGSAGIFTGKNRGQSGFGFFVNIASYVNELSWEIPNGTILQRKLSLSSLPQSLEPSKKQREKIEKNIIELNRKKVRLKY